LPSRAPLGQAFQFPGVLRFDFAFRNSALILFQPVAYCNPIRDLRKRHPNRSRPLETEKTRLQMLEEALQATPNNAFLRYALALELANAGRAEEARQQFQHLLQEHPDYAATYYQAGVFHAKCGRVEEAREILTKGMQVTGRQGNTHAQQEIQAALDELAGDAC
jgi:tetratricopeptide (TPR) repeat protein